MTGMMDRSLRCVPHQVESHTTWSMLTLAHHTSRRTSPTPPDGREVTAMAQFVRTDNQVMAEMLAVQSRLQHTSCCESRTRAGSISGMKRERQAASQCHDSRRIFYKAVRLECKCSFLLCITQVSHTHKLSSSVPKIDRNRRFNLSDQSLLKSRSRQNPSWLGEKGEIFLQYVCRETRTRITARYLQGCFNVVLIGSESVYVLVSILSIAECFPTGVGFAAVVWSGDRGDRGRHHDCGGRRTSSEGRGTG